MVTFATHIFVTCVVCGLMLNDLQRLHSMTDSVVVDLLRTVLNVSSFPLNPTAFLNAPWAQLRWRAINILVIILSINQSTVDLFGASGL